MSTSNTERKTFIQTLNPIAHDLIESARDRGFKGIDDHPEMECKDKRGRVQKRYLYEVTQDVVQMLRGKSEALFIEYHRQGGGMPREVELRKGVEKDPFKQARHDRKKGFRKLPKGVMPGSSLFAKTAARV